MTWSTVKSLQRYFMLMCIDLVVFTAANLEQLWIVVCWQRKLRWRGNRVLPSTVFLKWNYFFVKSIEDFQCDRRSSSLLAATFLLRELRRRRGSYHEVDWRQRRQYWTWIHSRMLVELVHFFYPLSVSQLSVPGYIVINYPFHPFQLSNLINLLIRFKRVLTNWDLSILCKFNEIRIVYPCLLFLKQTFKFFSLMQMYMFYLMACNWWL